MQLKKTPRDHRFGAADDPFRPSTATDGIDFTAQQRQPQAPPQGPSLANPQKTQQTQEDSHMAQEPMSPPEGTTVTRNRGEHAPAVVNESVIDGNSTFEGKFETDQDLRVLGSLGGEVICRGRLTIEKDAVARAKLQARDATIRGRIEGDIVCTGRLDLANTAVIHGTIKAGLLAVEEGATVQGSVEVGNPPAIAPSRGGNRKGGAAENANAATDDAEAPLPSFSSARMNRRESPSFALVSSEERTNP